MSIVRKPLGRIDRAEVWSKSSGVCHYCGEQTNPFIDFTVDHIVPVSKGGTNDPGNLVAACARCNNAKRDKVGLEKITYGCTSSRIVYLIEPNHIDDGFVQVNDAKRLTGMNWHAFERLIDQGEFPIYKAGRRMNSTRYVRLDDIQHLLAA